MTPQRVSRWIRGYDNLQGSMLMEYRLPESWTLERLQELFGVSKDNPMFDCYPISDGVARVLEPTVGVPLVCDGREFFLEADADKASDQRPCHVPIGEYCYHELPSTGDAEPWRDATNCAEKLGAASEQVEDWPLSSLRSQDPRRRAVALRALGIRPSGDPRVLPVLEELLEDRTACIVNIPLEYGELRFLASMALAVERYKQGIGEHVRAPGTILPLTANSMHRIADAAAVPSAGGGWRELFETLRERGLLPTEDIDWPPEVVGRLVETEQDLPNDVDG